MPNNKPLSRDPRTAPRVGDVFRGRRSERTITQINGGVIRYRTTYIGKWHKMTAPEESLSATTSHVAWAKNAEVIHASK